MRSSDILELLRAKHREDIFVPECKNGPTWASSHMRMDAWVMRRSWSHPLTIVYEIKVSRSDFINDNKWPDYLNYCNQLFFVCPRGIISPDELPPEAGLMYVSFTGNMIITKKKAAHRQVDVPVELYQYLLMSRCRITAGQYENTKESKEEFFKNWVKSKEEKLELGHLVGKRIKRIINNEINAVRAENRELKQAIENMKDVREFCERNNIGLDGYLHTSKLYERIGMPRDIIYQLDSGINAIQRIKQLVGEDKP